jgi:hypothetical protein
MDALPAELLYKAFHPLHQKDKLECLLVCRAWKQALENTVLFTTVRLQSKLQLNKLVSKIYRDPSKSNGVERLILEIKDIQSAEIDILSFLFFNIRELEFYGSANKDYDPMFTKTLSFHSWSKSIKRIIEPSNNVFTNNSLKESLCPVLSEISICGKEYQSGEELTTLLANAPALKCLLLQNYSLSLLNLELLHDKLPLLSSLSFCEIKANSNILPTEVKPAKYMTKLFLNTVYTSSTDKYIDFQKYMINKYSKLTNIRYYVIVGNFNLSEAMHNGLIPQMQQIAPYLTTLTLMHSFHTRHAFPALDLHGCQLKDFTVTNSMSESEINEIANSKQTQFIEKLSLHSIPDNISQILLSKLSVLTVLSINQNSGTQRTKCITINRLLKPLGNNISTLKLTFTNLLLDVSAFSKCHSLKTLKLKRCSLPMGMNFFISQAFSKLSILIIDACTGIRPSFYLGDLNLSYLEFRDTLPSDQDKVLVVETSRKTKRWYSADKKSESNPEPANDRSSSPAMKFLPFDKYVGIPYATFVCDTLYEFFMVNTRF